MKRMVARFSIVAMITMIAATAYAAESKAVDPDKVPDMIQERYETMKTFTADFEQELTNIASGEVERRTGKVWFGQPSLLRWENESPEKEVLVIGPDVAWDYFADDKMAYKYPVELVLDSKTMLRFISGQANLREDFIIKSDWDGAEVVRTKWGKGLTILQLQPREPEPGLVLAYVGVDPETALLRQLMIVDFYGNGNEVRLTNVKIDIPVKADMFTFTPPEGVMVEDNTQQ